MRRSGFMGVFILVGLSLAGVVRAEGFKLDMCDSPSTKGWAFYCSDPVQDEEEQEETVPQELPETPIKEASEFPATDAMMAFRAHADELKYRAVLDPTPENVLAYMEVNKEIAERAGDFTEAWQRILFATPHLNANVDYPLATVGANVWQDQMKAAREEAFRDVAREAGLLFIFDGDATCGICKVQGQILAQMEETYGVSILAVSKDGGTNAFYPTAFTDAGRLKEMGLQDYPTPTLALAKPDTGEVSVIGSGILTADQILETIHTITKVPLGERY